MSYDYSTWMGSHVHPGCLIGNIVLLGTHNSGSYNAQNTIMVKCQEKSIAEQLQGGVRVFDIRVRVQNAWYVMHHNDHCPLVGNEVERQKYEHALGEMKAFLARCNREVILIILRGSENGNLTETQKYYVLSKVKDVFGDLLFDGPLSGNTTYGALLRAGKRVLLVAKDDLNRTQAGGARPAWALEDTLINSSWISTQSSYAPTDQEKLDLVQSLTETLVKSRAEVVAMSVIRDRAGWPTNERVLQQSDFNIWTTNIGGLAESRVNPMATRLLRDWTTDFMTKWGVNIVMVDFFNLPNTDLIDTIIQANRIKTELIIRMGLASPS